jgi:hypothetical protein
VDDAAGKITAEGAKPQQQPLVLWARTLLAGEHELDFTGKGWSARWPTARAVDVVNNDADKAWAIAATATEASFVVQQAPRGFQHHGRLPSGKVAEIFDETPAALRVEVGRFLGDSPTSYSSRRSAHLPGHGCGAIADDGRIAVTMSDGRFFLYDGVRSTSDGSLHELAATRLDFEPTDISVVDGGFAVRGAAGVHLLDATGKELWRVTIPFAVDAPPIDAGRGRVFLTSRRLAARGESAGGLAEERSQTSS